MAAPRQWFALQTPTPTEREGLVLGLLISVGSALVSGSAVLTGVSAWASLLLDPYGAAPQTELLFLAAMAMAPLSFAPGLYGAARALVVVARGISNRRRTSVEVTETRLAYGAASLLAAAPGVLGGGWVLSLLVESPWSWSFVLGKY